MKKIFVLIALLSPFLTVAQDIATRYKVYDVKNAKPTTIDAIVKDLTTANVLFFGEEHNDSIGHYLEAELFRKMNIAFPGKTALTMEMFHTDVQSVIDEYLKGIISEKNFIKEARAWNNYKDYKPMIELAKTHQLDVIGGNAAARYSNAVTRGGLGILNQVPANSKAFFAPLPIDTATGRYLDKFTATLGGHNMGGMKVYQTQNFWDATMAWSIAKYAKKNKDTKIFQVNGRFHSDEKLGTLAKLKAYAPKLNIINISCFSAEDFENPDWEKYKALGDYVIVTDPKVKRSF